MAEAKDDYIQGTEILGTDINKISETANDGGGFRDDRNAGETINGGTLPVAIYIDTSDNEVYACDGNDTDKLQFIGFAISNSTDGNSIEIQCSGIVRGFSGLDEGEKYYVQDDKTIGTSKGTYPIVVGIAISATELLIISDIEGATFRLITSATIRASADTERTGIKTSAVYAKQKEFRILQGGVVSVAFDLAGNTSEQLYGRIYVNGVAIGTERTIISSAAYETFTEDISVELSDLIQLYVKSSDSFAGASIKNFRLHWEKLVNVDYIVITD